MLNIPLLAFPLQACSWASYGLLVVAYDLGAREVVESPLLTRGTLLGPWAPSLRGQFWRHLAPCVSPLGHPVTLLVGAVATLMVGLVAVA